MNQSKLITEILNKYSDFPNVSRDMLKLLKYTESHFRNFLTPLFKNYQPTAADDAIDTIMEPYTDDQEAQKAFSAVAMTIKNSITDPDAPQQIKDLLAALQHRPELRSAVVAAGKLFADAAKEAIADAR